MFLHIIFAMAKLSNAMPTSPTHYNAITSSGENRLLVTNELIEFEKSLLEVEGFSKIIDHFEGI